MMVVTKEEYYNSELDYHLDCENVADCKYKESVNGFEVLALNENADQFMIFNNDGKVSFIIDTYLEQVKEFLSVFF